MAVILRLRADLASITGELQEATGKYGRKYGSQHRGPALGISWHGATKSGGSKRTSSHSHEIRVRERLATKIAKLARTGAAGRARGEEVLHVLAPTMPLSVDVPAKMQ